MINNDQLSKLKEKLTALPLHERKALLVKFSKPTASISHKLTAAQKRLWLLEQFERVPYLYHVPLILRSKGPLDKNRIESAIKILMAKHLQLSSFVVNRAGTIEQHYADIQRIEVAELTLAQPLSNVINIDTSHLLSSFFLQPFDLMQPPLFRVAIVKNQDNYYLVMCFHHLIMDAWSAGLFLQDLIKSYNGEVLKNTTYTYADYVKWENNPSSTYEKELIYWENKLSDSLWAIDLINDFPRPQYLSGKGNNYLLPLPSSLFCQLTSYAKSNHVSINHVILSTFQILLSRYSNQEDITLGIPTAGREQSSWQQTIGLFVNTCLHHRKIDYQLSFKEHLLKTKNEFIEDLQHASVPYDQLVSHFYHKQLCVQGASFNVLYNFIQLDSKPIGCMDTYSVETLLCLLPMSKFDISLHVFMNENELNLLFEYSLDLFIETTIAQIANEFVTQINTFINNDKCPIHDLMWVI